MSILLPTRRALNVGAWAKNSLWKTAKSVPSLDLRFAENKSLTDEVSKQNLITFTRASSGTYVGSDGLIKTAAVDTPRFDHNPTTGESLGLLVEESRTNLLLRSEEFDNASWTKINSTVTADAITAPNGAIAADLLTENTSNSVHALNQNFTFTQGVTYSASIYVKQGPGSRFLCLNIAGGAPGATFNLANQTFATAASSQTNVSASINPLPNGWFRCVLTWTHAMAFTASTVRVTLSNNSASGSEPTYTGDGTSGIYIWGAQLEVGSFPTSYIPTTSATVTRSADVASITGTNFSSWYRQDEMTLYAAYSLLETTGNAATNRPIFYTDNGSGGSRMFYLAAYSGTAARRPRYFDDSTTDMFPASTSNKFAVALAQDNNAACIDNGAITSDTTGSPISQQTRSFIGWSTSTQRLCGTLSRLTYWQSRLPNSTLQDLTR